VPQLDFVSQVEVVRTPRVVQLEGMFDVPPTQRSENRWSIHLPIDDDDDWRIGLIVGPSGSGKTTLARQAFGDNVCNGYDWPTDRSIVDGFPERLGIKEITALLSSVGFSSPPSWLRPFRCLSNGEQFRVTLARALADDRPVVVMDEFTSVVDRTVAQIGSAAVARAVRRTAGRRFVAVTCHYDVEEWLCPDWVVEMPGGEFARRSLRRPPITLTIRRVHRDAWRLFRRHHYLDTTLNVASYCFAAWFDDRPVTFAAVLHYPHPSRPGYRGHRTVCLPDYQGVGIGNAMSEFVASLFVATGKPYRSVTGNPAMIRHRCRSSLWKMIRKPSLNNGMMKNSPLPNIKKFSETGATNRYTASFEYVGPSRPDDARRFGLPVRE
jgi:ABC-type nitrate/sulfonate/bicarbonate transport system ATPase subunit